MSAGFPNFQQAAIVLVVAVMASFSASCSRDNRDRDIKQCIADVQKKAATGAINDLQAADSSEERHDKLGTYVAACMRQAGYGHANFDMSDARCVDDVDFKPYCYARGR